MNYAIWILASILSMICNIQLSNIRYFEGKIALESNQLTNVFVYKHGQCYVQHNNRKRGNKNPIYEKYDGVAPRG